MFTGTATIQNGQGIHCRPSSAIIKSVLGYPGTVLIQSAKGDCDLRSVLDLIALGLECGEEVRIRVEGPDAETTGQRLVELFQTHFDFPPRD